MERLTLAIAAIGRPLLRLQLLIFYLASFAIISGVGGRYGVILSAFAIYFLALHVVIFLVRIWRAVHHQSGLFADYPRFSHYLLDLVPIGFYLLVAIPYFVSQQEYIPSSKGIPFLKILYANTLAEKNSPEALLGIIRREAPDVVALTEFNAIWAKSFETLTEYGNKRTIERNDGFGMALFSKIKFEGEPSLSIGEELPPVILAKLAPEGKPPVNFYLVHLEPPFFADSFRKNLLILRRVLTPIMHEDTPSILCGDLNSSPFGSPYKAAERWGRFKNVLLGRGMPPTWNMFSSFLKTTIDHVLVRGPMVVNTVDMTPPFGSDHRGYIVQLNWD